jgi:hypothetical protein
MSNFTIRALELDNLNIQQRIAALQEQWRRNNEALAVLRYGGQHEPPTFAGDVDGTLGEQYQRYVRTCASQYLTAKSFMDWYAEREAQLQEVLPHVSE